MIKLDVQKREVFGKKVKSLKTQGLIPAELYGHNRPNFHLSVSAKEFFKVFREAGETTIINLSFEKEELPVLVHEVTKDPLGEGITHIDFYQVKMDEKIDVPIPLEFIGEASAVREKEGVLVKAMQEVEVRALPANLPSRIDVDVSVLNDIGESIYVKDLNLPAGVEPLIDGETVVVTITEQAVEEVSAGPESVEEVKVEGEAERAERQEGDDSKKSGESKPEKKEK